MTLRLVTAGEVPQGKVKTFIEWLLEFWTTGEVRAEVLLALSQSLAFSAGRISARRPIEESDDERDAMLQVAGQALRIGAWMIHAGIERATHLGPFGPRRPTVGEKVRIRKGAVVNVLGERRVIDSKETEDMQTVKVESMSDWSVDWRKIAAGDPAAIRETTVWWRVRGVRYWTCISNVQTMDQAKSQSPMGQPWRVH